MKKKIKPLSPTVKKVELCAMPHTREPWEIAESGVDVRSPGSATGALAYVSTAGARGRTLAEAKANAARIVACVNACAGLSNPKRQLPLLLPRVLRREE